LFRSAQREYLTGNWIKAEQLLTQLLTNNTKDIDAHLMMASLLRHTGQLAEASDRLRRLETMDGAEKWASEITRERHLLDELFSPPENSSTEQQQPEQNLTTSTNPAEQKTSAKAA
jgi:predicted Zn-dependent protease